MAGVVNILADHNVSQLVTYILVPALIRRRNSVKRVVATVDYLGGQRFVRQLGVRPLLFETNKLVPPIGSYTPGLACPYTITAYIFPVMLITQPSRYAIFPTNVCSYRVTHVKDFGLPAVLHWPNPVYNARQGA